MTCTKKPKRTIEPSDLVAIVDTREQCPLDLEPLKWERGSLPTGDYSVRGLEHLVSIERKSLPDLLACVSAERERFEREIQRLLSYPTRAVVVEATWGELEAGSWRPKVTAAAALGSVLGWIGMGIPFVMAGNHAAAGRYVSRLLFISARRRWRELQSFQIAVGTLAAKKVSSAPTEPLAKVAGDCAGGSHDPR